MHSIFRISLSCVVLSSSLSAVAEEPPVTLPIQRLSMDMALKAARMSIEACRNKGLNISVTVVDRGGHEQVTLRDTLTVPVTLTVSKQKAYAAMNFNAPTSDLEDRFSSPFSPGKVEGIVLSAGALPIEAGLGLETVALHRSSLISIKDSVRTLPSGLGP